MTRRASILRAAAFVLVMLVASACGPAGSSGGSGGPGGSPGPGASGGPTGSGGAGTLTEGQLRLAIMDRFGPRWWCDPDFYPIAHQDEGVLAVQKFAQIQADAGLFAAIVAKLGLAGTTTFSDAQKLAIYQLWKPAASFPFQSAGSDRYSFDYLAEPPTGAQEGLHVQGTITSTGAISIDQQAPAGEPNCPICLARGTPIDTPNGEVAVEALGLGDPVWTLDGSGNRIAGRIIALGSTAAPAGHVVIHLTLEDGRMVTASPGHPLADGRRLGELRVGDLVDGSAVASLAIIPYEADRTFDIAVSGPTGIYLSDGIPLGSTIEP